MIDQISSFSQLLPFLVALLIASGIAGFLAGVFGIGGGAILVPVFYQMYGELGVDELVRMHLSVGTSLAIIVPTSIRSFLSHRKRGNADIELLRSWVFVVPAGVVLASLITAYISGAGLRVIFAFVAIVVGAKLLFAKDNWQLGNDIPGNPVRAIAGGLIGFFSTFMGIGGGVMNNTFMMLYGRPMLQAISTSSGVGVLISIPGTVGYILAGLASADNAILPDYSFGYVNLLTVAFIIPTTLLFAPLGVRAAHALSRRHLEIAFGVFMFVVAGRFLASLF